MPSVVIQRALYWILVAASVAASIMALDFVGAMWPQISASATATTKALAAIFILLPAANLALRKAPRSYRLAVAVALIATQAGIILI